MKNGNRYMGSVNADDAPHGSGRKFDAKGSLVYVGEFHLGEPVSLIDNFYFTNSW